MIIKDSQKSVMFIVLLCIAFAFLAQLTIYSFEKNKLVSQIKFEMKKTLALNKKKGDIEKDIELKSEIEQFDEKLNSINKRLDDFLVYLGIIVTLLLSIVVASYISAENQVAKYFKEHYEEINSKLQNYDTKAEELFSEFKAKRDLYLRELQKNTMPPPQEPIV